jgi:ferredoxin
MAKEIAHGSLDIDLTIIYGSVKHTDIVLYDVLEEARKAAPDKIHVVHVMSDDEEWDGEKGFVTEEIIRKYSPEGASYFFCGPPVMFFLIEKVMKEMGVPLKRFRHDASAQPAVKLIPGFPMEQVGKTYKMTVVRGIHEDVIDAAADEPVAVALERAAIPIDTHCRGGECGYCRTQLLEGDIFVSPLNDGRRAMDKELGWFHACSAYPTSDLKIKIPII